jgi:hypothetical protein
MYFEELFPLSLPEQEFPRLGIDLIPLRVVKLLGKDE